MTRPEPAPENAEKAPNEDERRHALSGLVWNIAEQKRGEEELRRLAETLELAVEAADLGTWAWDPATDQITLSKRSAEIYGLTPDRTYSREWMRSLLHPEDRGRARLAAARSVANRTDYDMEYRLDRPTPVWVAIRGRGIHDQAGRLVRMLGVVQDVTARKQAEAALRESEERQRQLADNLPSGFIYQIVHGADDNRRFTYVSRGVEALCGLFPADVMADPTRLYGIIVPEDLDRVLKAEVESYQTWPPFDCQFRIRVQGEVRWLHCRSGPRPLPDGGAIWDGVAIEVTEQRRAEEAIREREQRALDILENITDAFLSLGPDWRFTYVNRQAELVLSRQPGDLLGRDIWTEYPGLIGSEFERAFRNAMFHAQASAVTAYYPDHARWYEAHTYPSTDGIAVYFRNVTERVAGEMALKESEERYRRAASEAARAAEMNAKFRAFFEQGTNFAGVLSLDGVVVEANRLCLDNFGFTREEVVGKPFWDCGWWNRSDDLREIIRGAAAEAVAGCQFRTETRCFKSDGSERVVDLILAPVTDDRGSVLFVAATGTDVTELREGDRKKDDFIALLAHELRNPLAPIRNGLEVLRLSDRDPEAANRAQDMMDRQLSHLVRLVDDLLDVSRIGRNKMELRRAPVTLAEVVDSAIDTVRPLIEAGRHELVVSLPSIPVVLNADLTRLSQVFSNLLSNSAKYTPPVGRISLTAESGTGEVVVRVTDSGIGIPADALASIFDMFNQLDRNVERCTGGLGIGLALVKGLVEMHGGTVTAESDGVDRGSTFTVRLPASTESPSAAAASSAAARHCGRQRVLVVDDNRDGCESMAMMLDLLGYEVRVAHDGEEGVFRAERYRPDVVLMDLGMPRLNGLDATRRIREQPWGKEMLIVAVTGWGQEHDRERSRAAGCDAHLVKPVSLSDLRSALDEPDYRPTDATNARSEAGR